MQARASHLPAGKQPSHVRFTCGSHAALLAAPTRIAGNTLHGTDSGAGCTSLRTRRTVVHIYHDNEACKMRTIKTSTDATTHVVLRGHHRDGILRHINARLAALRCDVGEVRQDLR